MKSSGRLVEFAATSVEIPVRNMVEARVVKKLIIVRENLDHGQPLLQ